MGSITRNIPHFTGRMRYAALGLCTSQDSVAALFTQQQYMAYLYVQAQWAASLPTLDLDL